MNRAPLTLLVASVLCPSVLLAGGSELIAPSSAILFKDGNVAEFRLTVLDAKVSGSVPLGTTTQQSKDIAKQDFVLGFGFKRQLNDKSAYAVVYEQPHGARIDYGAADAIYPYRGSHANLSEQRLTLWGKYQPSERVSVFGGPFISQTKMDARVAVTVPNPADPTQLVPALNYNGSAPANSAAGFAVGAAYEIKPIAMRIALTYFSELDFDTTATESATGVNGGAPFAVPETTSSTSYKFPQSVTLAFQSGVNPKTLVFGSIRWAEWTEQLIKPDLYAQVTTNAANPTGGSLVSHDDDTITLNLGVGRKISETVSILGGVSYEESQGGLASNLSPTDGKTGISLGLLYRQPTYEILAGISHTMIGDAETNAQVGEAQFRDNSANAFGVTLTTKF